MAPSIPGVLHQYPRSSDATDAVFESGDLSSTKLVIFLPGLGDGLGTVPYVSALSQALGDAGWCLAQPYLSTAYKAYGKGSLKQDVNEIERVVEFFKARGKKEFVLWGHSTGCQQSMQYLISNPPRSAIDKVVLQAPVSDREANILNPALTSEVLELVKRLYHEDGGRRRSELLPVEAREAFGCDVTVYRAFSLACIGGDDDFFSSDLPLDREPGSSHRPLSETFGRIPAETRVLAIFSGADEFTPDPERVQRIQLERWQLAAPLGQVEGSVVPGARHAVDDKQGIARLCEVGIDFLRWRRA